jgi:hypothetical protein
MIEIKLNWTNWSPAVREMLASVQDRTLDAVTHIARAIAKELRAAAPSGGTPSPARAKLRAKKPGVYGPIARGVRTSAAQPQARSFRFSTNRRYALPPFSAAVFVKTFYAGFVEYGTNPEKVRVRKSVGRALRSYRYHPAGHPAHPFAGPVIARANSIAEAELKRFLG